MKKKQFWIDVTIRKPNARVHKTYKVRASGVNVPSRPGTPRYRRCHNLLIEVSSAAVFDAPPSILSVTTNERWHMVLRRGKNKTNLRVYRSTGVINTIGTHATVEVQLFVFRGWSLGELLLHPKQTKIRKLTRYPHEQTIARSKYTNEKYCN